MKHLCFPSSFPNNQVPSESFREEGGMKKNWITLKSVSWIWNINTCNIHIFLEGGTKLAVRVAISQDLHKKQLSESRTGGRTQRGVQTQIELIQGKVDGGRKLFLSYFLLKRNQHTIFKKSILGKKLSEAVWCIEQKEIVAACMHVVGWMDLREYWSQKNSSWYFFNLISSH